MAAARVTNAKMPPKVTGDELFAEEVEFMRAAINEHADELDARGTPAPGTSSTYFETTFNAPADGVQTITVKQVPGLADATEIVQVGVLSADGTFDPEFGPGTGYTFDVATHTLRVFAGDKAPGDYIKRDDVLLLKWVTGSISPAPPASAVGFKDLNDSPYDNQNLGLELNAKAALLSPEFDGTPTAPNQPDGVAGNEIVNAAWIRQLLASQLNLSPFTSGGGRILHVCGRGQTTPGEAGNPNRPFATLPAAHDVAQAGDIVLVWPGGGGQDSFGRVYYTEAYTQVKPLSVYLLPGVIYGADIYFGSYGGSAPANHYLSGGEFLARILQARQSGAQSQLLVENAKFTGALGGVQYVANLPGGDGGPHVDQFITRGCIFDSKRSAGNSAPIRNNGTQYFGNCDMLVDNCLVMTTETPCAIYSAREGGSIQFLGTTECRPGGGQPALQSLPPNGGGNAVPEAQWFRDLRPTRSGGTPSIDYANPVVHSDATALDATALGKLNQFTGTGQTSWSVALPDPAGQAGKLIYLQIAASASGMWNFSGSGYTVSMWAKETTLLRCTGTGYERLSGNKVPMSAVVSIATQHSPPNSDIVQNLPMGDVYELPMPVVVADASGGQLAGGGGFVIPRSGYWLVSFGGKFNLNSGAIVQIFTKVNGSRYAKNISFGTATSGGGIAFPLFATVPKWFEAGDTIRFAHYADPGTNLAIYAGDEYVNFQPNFCLTEQPS